MTIQITQIETQTWDRLLDDVDKILVEFIRKNPQSWNDLKEARSNVLAVRDDLRNTSDNVILNHRLANL